MSLTTIGSLGYGGQHLNDVLPKILTELQGLTISGPIAGVAANAALAVPDNGGIEVEDTILKVLSFNGTSPAAFTDVTADTTIVNRSASGTLTVGAVAAGDSVSVDGIAYTFQAVQVTPSTNLKPGVVPIGSTQAASAANLAQAINALDGDTVQAVANGNVVTVTAVAEGVGGNAITLSVASSNGHVTDSGATLAGGTATNAVKVSVSTATDQVFVIWFKKDRNLLQP